MSVSKMDQWTKHVAAWRASELPISEFCAQKSLSAWQFAYWKKRLSKESVADDGTDLVSAKFAEVIVDDSGVGRVPMIVIITSSGCRLEIPA